MSWDCTPCLEPNCKTHLAGQKACKETDLDRSDGIRLNARPSVPGSKWGLRNALGME